MNDRIIDSNENVFSWILTFDDEIINASRSFNTLTEFDINEVLGKNIHELWKMLRLNNILDYSEKTLNNECFLFTKSSSIKEVTISQEKAEGSSQVVYIIKEKVEVEFGKKFPFMGQTIDENLVGAAVIKVPEMILIKANQRFLNLLEGPFNCAENSIGKHLGDIVAGCSESVLGELWEQFFEANDPFKIEEQRYYRFERGGSYFSSNLTPVFEDGKLKYYFKIVHDITENVLSKKRVEEQNRIIKDQNLKFEAIIENMSDSVFIVYENGEIVRLNKAAREIDPLEIEEWYNHARYYNGNGTEINYQDIPLPRVINGEKIKDFYLTIDNGKSPKHMIINGTPILNENGEFQFGIICSKDVTEHVKSQMKMFKQKDNFNKIIRNLDMPILRISYPDLKIVDYNNKLYECLKSMSGDITVCMDYFNIGESISDLVYEFEKSKTYKCVQEVGKTKNIVYLDKLETIQNGNRKVSKLILQPLLDTNENIMEIFIISHDVTSIIEEKEGLEKLLKMQEEFFSFISHEFKTPLSVISAAVQAMELLCRNELSEMGNGFLHNIKRSTLQQLRLVNNLLDIARADAGYLKLHKKNRNIVQMTDLIINSVEPFADEKGVKIDFNADEDNITILIDDEKYERILLNLLSNSIKFTPEGKNIYVDLFKEDEKVFIEVRDEGIGIPKEKHQAIFNRFEQADNGYIRNSSGTGIGLCLVKLLVEAMDGQIIFESQEGEGTCFRIMFPFSITEEEEPSMYNLMDNRLVEVRNIEFSNIYLD